jgi:AraC-like DNA-binding protein
METQAAPVSAPDPSLLHVEEVTGKNRPLMKTKHYHDRFEIYLFKGNEVKYFIEDKTFHLKKNDIILIDRYVLHKTYSMDKEYRRLLIHFHPGYLEGLPAARCLLELFSRKSRESNLISPCPSELSEIDALSARLKNRNGADSPYRQVMEAALLIQLLAVLNDAWDRSARTRDSGSLLERSSRVREVLRYINLNFWEELSLEQLADRFFINKYHLCHIFKKYTGFTMVEYINKKRIAEAENMLVNSNLKITEIAFKTGFNSLSHFIRVFKNITGVSPRMMRRP